MAAIKHGHLSAVEYIEAVLDRADELIGLRAIITLNRRGALRAARKVDLARRSGHKLGALSGLPIVVKDNINTKKLPTSAGTLALRDFIPETDAPALRPLIAAGAIVIGKANMHELAFGITTTNFAPFAGFAQNPYDRARIPGGSSGGTASSIAARIVPAGLGTDTGASVRLPSAYNGVVGLRPSVGDGGSQRRYPSKGVVPLSHTLDTVGPIGRKVADVALLDAVITGSSIPKPAHLKRIRLGVPGVLWAGLDDEVAEVATAARAKLTKAGVTFVDADIPSLLDLVSKTIGPIALHEPITDIPAYLEDSGAQGITLRSIADRVSSPDVRTIFKGVLADAEGDAYPDAIKVYRPQIQKLVADYFVVHKVDALFFPTSPVRPARIDVVNGSGTISVNGGPPVPTFGTADRNTAPGSCAGMPGLSLPAGLSVSGLPIGIDLEGAVGTDKTILSIGMAVEAVLGTVPAPRIQ